MIKEEFRALIRPFASAPAACKSAMSNNVQHAISFSRKLQVSHKGCKDQMLDLGLCV
jgi:hypothetical protein